ncbi:hypothetical protein [Lentzea sp.]|uniref:hypothetical protein n=1 Tax=Lentzea sp. TaxID=56099 RepID=UPI002ED49F6F
MRDDRLDELLAAADRQFQRAFHAEPGRRVDGLAAIIGHPAIIGHAEPRQEVEGRRREIWTHVDIPELPGSLPPFLRRRIQLAVRLLGSSPTGSQEAVTLLNRLRQGLEDRVLDRDEALALVREAKAEVSERQTRTSRLRVLDKLRVIEVEVERLFDDTDDRAGRSR